ncbi:MAG: hypothetical protein M1836_003316 [Candelina mexicana]|nr:MAG: hypothetical protein M1836_003316 [Candelina mexicana]
MLTSIAFAALSSLVLVNGQAPLINGSLTGTNPVPGTTGKLGDAQPAPQVNGLTCLATLPNRNTTDIRGYVQGTGTASGTNWTISLSGFPSQNLGPFLYHIHDQPVPANGNCTATLAHLDPTQRGEIPPCDPTAPQTCQVGDLAGKHGNITTSPFNQNYIDKYTSTQSGLGAFFGNRSIVVHTSNTTRLTCANFVCSFPNGTTPSGSGNSSTTTKPATPTFTGGASAKVLSAGAAICGLFAAFML